MLLAPGAPEAKMTGVGRSLAVWGKRVDDPGNAVSHEKLADLVKCNSEENAVFSGSYESNWNKARLVEVDLPNRARRCTPTTGV